LEKALSEDNFFCDRFCHSALSAALGNDLRFLGISDSSSCDMNGVKSILPSSSYENFNKNLSSIRNVVTSFVGLNFFSSEDSESEFEDPNSYRSTTEPGTSFLW